MIKTLLAVATILVASVDAACEYQRAFYNKVGCSENSKESAYMYIFDDDHPPKDKKCFKLKTGSASLYEGPGKYFGSGLSNRYKETCYSTYMYVTKYSSGNTRCTGSVSSANAVKLKWNTCYKSSKMSNGKQFYIKYKKGKLMPLSSLVGGVIAGIVVGVCCYCCCCGACIFMLFKKRKAESASGGAVSVVVNN